MILDQRGPAKREGKRRMKVLVGTASWRQVTGRVQEVLSEGRDGPQGFTNTIPSVWESTHLQYALVRLHGCNRAT
jgi:hypothetical protein